MILLKLLCVVALIQSPDDGRPGLYNKGAAPTSSPSPASSNSEIQIADQNGEAFFVKREMKSALIEFNKILQINSRSSLANYRIGEINFYQADYDSALDRYRRSLEGDGEPHWTEVWSHIEIGKILDMRGRREDALNEYKQALQTGDNTRGATDEARKLLNNAFQLPVDGLASKNQPASSKPVAVANPTVPTMNMYDFARMVQGPWYIKIPNGKWLKAEFSPEGTFNDYATSTVLYEPLENSWRMLSSSSGFKDPSSFYFYLAGIETYKQAPLCHITSYQPDMVFSCVDQGRPKNYVFVRTGMRTHAKPKTLSAVNNKHLMTAPAQVAVDRALDEFVAAFSVDPNAIVIVQGVAENMQDNTASADLTFSHVEFDCRIGDIRQGQRWSSGKALFKHYTDGRWVLTDLRTDSIPICTSGWHGSLPVH
jgi:tetratricopeptide (TPR) repeat protein